MDRIIEQTEQWWRIPTHSWFHHLISLIIGQRIAFTRSRKIRQTLYEELNRDKLIEFTPEWCLARKWSELPPRQITTILEVSKLAQQGVLDLAKYQAVKGVGDWTVKALQVMLNLSPNIVLFEDKWIQQRIGELYDSPPSPALVKLMLTPVKNSTQWSNFFWRIQPSGIKSLKMGKTLQREDFV